MSHASILGDLIHQVLVTGEPQSLTEKEAKQFHADFGAEIAPAIEKLRANQRKAVILQFY